MTRIVLTAATALVTALALAGCATTPAADAPARLLLKDGEKRVPGDPCNGSGPYRDIHATAAFTVRDAAGEVIAEGELPQGESVKMIDIDFDGIAEPTACAFTLGAAVPGAYDRVYLDTGERTDIVMMPNQDDGVWEAILP